MPQSSESRRERITLPPIRDIFRDELSKLHWDLPSIGLAPIHTPDEPYNNGMQNKTTYSMHGPVSQVQYPLHSATSYRQEYDTRGRHHPSVIQPSDRWSLPRSGHYSCANDARPLFHNRRDGLNMPTMHQHAAAADYRSQSSSGGTQYLPPLLRHGHPPYISSHRPHSESDTPGLWRATGQSPDRTLDDEEQTFNRHGQSRPPSSEGCSASGPTQAKYECTYCGKGFNRPSSLKIHLNSHTGEKPFVCPVENCGRGFSVLSNMRRHARVHTQNSFEGP
ncbi:hypothetical protein AX15_003676 [Amanita polypyramis BW_CC]|nr:hypothetical protein AX15_003676 [Amanita polypyramis BW_CC]